MKSIRFQQSIRHRLGVRTSPRPPGDDGEVHAPLPNAPAVASVDEMRADPVETLTELVDRLQAEAPIDE